MEALEERRSEVDVAVASLADEEAEVNAKASAAARALERNGLNAVTGEPLAPPSEEASTTAGEAMARYQAKLAALRSRIDHQKGKLEEVSTLAGLALMASGRSRVSLGRNVARGNRRERGGGEWT